MLNLVQIVDEDSASPTVQDVERAGIQADHSHICKFENENSPGFDLVAEGIQRYAGDAPGTVRARWESEKEEQIRRRKETIEELLPTLPGEYLPSLSGKVRLTSLESSKGTPKTTSTNTTAGKMMALPAPENPSDSRSLFETEYEVEELDDKVEITR